MFLVDKKFRDGSSEFGGVISGSESLALAQRLFSSDRASLALIDLQSSLQLINHLGL